MARMFWAQAMGKEIGGDVYSEWLQRMDQLSCVVHLDPGDVLLFREDVWHRTQDESLDRVALILDVLRFPLANFSKSTRGTST